MSTWRATVRVTHMETWDVEATTEREARNKISRLDDDVQMQDDGGEVVDWETHSIVEVVDDDS